MTYPRSVKIALAVLWVSLIAYLCLLTVHTTDNAVTPMRRTTVEIPKQSNRCKARPVKCIKPITVPPLQAY